MSATAAAGRASPANAEIDAAEAEAEAAAAEGEGGDAGPIAADGDWSTTTGNDAIDAFYFQLRSGQWGSGTSKIGGWSEDPMEDDRLWALGKAGGSGPKASVLRDGPGMTLGEYTGGAFARDARRAAGEFVGARVDRVRGEAGVVQAGLLEGAHGFLSGTLRSAEWAAVKLMGPGGRNLGNVGSAADALDRWFDRNSKLVVDKHVTTARKFLGEDRAAWQLGAVATLTEATLVFAGPGAAKLVARGSRAGAAASRGGAVLPEALQGGEASVDVYFGVRNGERVYAGITNNPARRAAQHAARFELEKITSSPLTRGEARAVEQALIERNPGFENIRNSISPNHSHYQQAVDWGESWLTSNGY